LFFFCCRLLLLSLMILRKAPLVAIREGRSLFSLVLLKNLPSL
jgi:hypothetical protein